jgi:hypothetical protein
MRQPRLREDTSRKAAVRESFSQHAPMIVYRLDVLFFFFCLAGEYVLAIGLDEQILPGVETPGKRRRDQAKEQGEQVLREAESVRESAGRLADASSRARDREARKEGWKSEAFDL